MVITDIIEVIMVIEVIILTTTMLRRIGEAAPGTPLFYYHIPGFSGVSLPMAQFLQVDLSYIDITTDIFHRREAIQSRLWRGSNTQVPTLGSSHRCSL